MLKPKPHCRLRRASSRPLQRLGTILATCWTSRDALKSHRFDVRYRELSGKKLDLIGHRKGQTRFRKTEFNPGEAVSEALLGRASRFWATGKLLRLAAQCGIDSDNVREHFAPEPPMYHWS
jgi:hypothetical protein